MPRNPYLHELDDFSDLISIVADEKDIVAQLVEKDYWIMHCLHGLSLQGFDYELKGGTSLSKGYGIIRRFSEDIDIKILPNDVPFEVHTGKNRNKSRHIQSRKDYYDWLAGKISIEGFTSVARDTDFDDEKFRSGGIRLGYESFFEAIDDLKEGILLEVGFDDTTPNTPINISSWTFEKGSAAGILIEDNQAVGVKCYHPGYSFVEKLQTVSTKFRQQQASGKLPTNFMRHYYDISQLLDHPEVQEFIGTTAYNDRKKERFRTGDNVTISENEAFLISDASTKEVYRNAFQTTLALYYGEKPDFDQILSIIQTHIDRL